MCVHCDPYHSVGVEFLTAERSSLLSSPLAVILTNVHTRPSLLDYCMFGKNQSILTGETTAPVVIATVVLDQLLNIY